MALPSCVPPPSRRQAIDAIRALAKTAPGVPIERRAQSGVDRVGHDADDVSEVLSNLEERECIQDEEARNWPGCWLFVFQVELDDIELYVKVAIDCETLTRAQVVSYKPWGSPE